MKVRKKSDRVMAIVLTLSRVMGIICADGPQSGKPDTEKVRFYEMASEWETWEILVKSSFVWGFQWTCGEMC